MRILVDCRFAHLQAGLGRYAREMVRALVLHPSASSFEWHILAHPDAGAWFRTLPGSVRVHPCIIPYYSVAEQVQLPRLIAAVDPSLFLSLHFNVPLRCPVPFVATVHDLILHHFPNAAPLRKRLAYRFLMHSTLQRARALLVPTRFVAVEIRSVYGDAIGDLVRVTSEGVSTHFTRRGLEEIDRVHRMFQFPERFLLYVGSAKDHKNLGVLLSAFAQLHDPILSLVLVTPGKELASYAPLPPRVIVRSNVDDVDLPALYSAALCTVTTSLYEGFCLPVVEALACGCPVIATNRTAIPEVTQGCAQLVEPTVEAFAAAFAALPFPCPTGFVRPDWEVAAGRTIEVLERVGTNQL